MSDGLGEAPPPQAGFRSQYVGPDVPAHDTTLTSSTRRASSQGTVRGSRNATQSGCTKTARWPSYRASRRAVSMKALKTVFM